MRCKSAGQVFSNHSAGTKNKEHQNQNKANSQRYDIVEAHAEKYSQDRNRKKCEMERHGADCQSLRWCLLAVLLGNRHACRQLKSDNLKLSVNYEQLCTYVVQCQQVAPAPSHMAIATQEKKTAKPTRRNQSYTKGRRENSQLIVEPNIKVKQKRIIMSGKEHG